MVTVKSNAEVLQRAFQALRRDLPEQLADQAARKVALDVVGDIQRGLSGNVPGVPRRVDEGRLRGSYGAGAARVGLTPQIVGRASDGVGEEVKTRQGLSLTIGSNLEYATHVEEGTRRMEPGNHVARALAKSAQGLPLQELEEDLAKAIEAAWDGA